MTTVKVAALHFENALTLENNLVQSNTASSCCTAWGGGISLYKGHSSVIVSNTLQKNVGSLSYIGRGEGLYISAPDLGADEAYPPVFLPLVVRD